MSQNGPPDPELPSLPYDTRTWASRAQWLILDQSLKTFQKARSRTSTKFFQATRARCVAVSKDETFSVEDRKGPRGRDPIEPTLRQISTWYRNHDRARTRKQGQKLIKTILARLAPTRTRAAKLLEVYQRLYRTKVKEAVAVRMKALADSGVSKDDCRKRYMNVNEEVRSRLYELEPEEVQKIVDAYYNEEKTEESKQARKANAEPSKAGRFGHVVECIERVILDFFQMLHEETGLMFSSVYGGVTACDEGKPSMDMGWAHVGRTPEGLTLKEYDYPATQAFGGVFARFVKDAIPSDKRKQLGKLWNAKEWDLCDLGLAVSDEYGDEDEDREDCDDNGNDPVPDDAPPPQDIDEMAQEQCMQVCHEPGPEQSPTMDRLRHHDGPVLTSLTNTPFPPPRDPPGVAVLPAVDPSLDDPFIPASHIPRRSLTTHAPAPLTAPALDNSSERFTPAGVAVTSSPPMSSTRGSSGESLQPPLCGGQPSGARFGSVVTTPMPARLDGPSAPIPMTPESWLPASDLILNGPCKSNSDFSLAMSALRGRLDEAGTDSWKDGCPSIVVQAISGWMADPERRMPSAVARDGGGDFARAWREWWRAIRFSSGEDPLLSDVGESWPAREARSTTTLRWLLITLAWWFPPPDVASPEWAKAAHDVRIYATELLGRNAEGEDDSEGLELPAAAGLKGVAKGRKRGKGAEDAGTATTKRRRKNPSSSSAAKHAGKATTKRPRTSTSSSSAAAASHDGSNASGSVEQGRDGKDDASGSNEQTSADEGPRRGTRIRLLTLKQQGRDW